MPMPGSCQRDGKANCKPTPQAAEDASSKRANKIPRIEAEDTNGLLREALMWQKAAVAAGLCSGSSNLGKNGSEVPLRDALRAELSACAIIQSRVLQDSFRTLLREELHDMIVASSQEVAAAAASLPKAVEEVMTDARKDGLQREEKWTSFEESAMPSSTVTKAPSADAPAKSQMDDENDTGDPRDYGQVSSVSVRKPTEMELLDAGLEDGVECEVKHVTKGLKEKFEPLVRWHDWFLDLREPKRHGKLAEFVHGPIFNCASAMTILLNAVYILHTTNYAVQNVGNDTQSFVVTDFLFVFVYSVEICLKLAVHQSFFFCNEDARWNIFDLAIVVTSFWEEIDSLADGDSALFDTSFMRSMRILRLGKVLRVFRLMQFFEELRLILGTILNSMLSLFWSIIMMLLVFYMFGILFVQGTTEYLNHVIGSTTPVDTTDLVRSFGSVEDAMLSLFKASTGGNDWTLYYQALNAVGPAYAFLYLFFIAFTHVCFMNILTVFFVERAIEMARRDRESATFEERRNFLYGNRELSTLCNEVDKDGTGTLSLSEFQQEMLNPLGPLRKYLDQWGLDMRDAELFFDMCLQSRRSSNLDGAGIKVDGVEIKAFIEGCMKIRGQAMSLDIQAIVAQMKQNHKASINVAQSLTSRLKVIENDVRHSNRALDCLPRHVATTVAAHVNVGVPSEGGGATASQQGEQKALQPRAPLPPLNLSFDFLAKASASNSASASASKDGDVSDQEYEPLCRDQVAYL